MLVVQKVLEVCKAIMARGGKGQCVWVGQNGYVERLENRAYRVTNVNMSFIISHVSL